MFVYFLDSFFLFFGIVEVSVFVSCRSKNNKQQLDATQTSKTTAAGKKYVNLLGGSAILRKQLPSKKLHNKSRLASLKTNLYYSNNTLRGYVAHHSQFIKESITTIDTNNSSGKISI